MVRCLSIVIVALLVLAVSTSFVDAARKNKSSLDWDPGKVTSDSAKFGGIIPDGDVYIAAVDSAELKLNGFHVTNDVKDDFYYGELRLPAGHHILIVYSIKPQEKRSIAAERGGAYTPGGSGNIKGATGGSSDALIVTKGGTGSKMLSVDIDVSAHERYIIKPGKTTEEWKVISGSTGKKIAVKFVPVFSSEE
jgi:hypothetical protein